jgi:hypothetical protein
VSGLSPGRSAFPFPPTPDALTPGPAEYPPARPGYRRLPSAASAASATPTRARPPVRRESSIGLLPFEMAPYAPPLRLPSPAVPPSAPPPLLARLPARRPDAACLHFWAQRAFCLVTGLVFGIGIGVGLTAAKLCGQADAPS